MFPVIPGWDVSGVVVQPGAAVDEFAVGDEVIGYVREDFLSRGTFAEYVAAPVRTLARKPLSLGFEEAAGLPLCRPHRYQVLHRTLKVHEGETVLVHAAAGGVGSLAVQLARHAGCRVVGTAGPRNHDYVRRLGGEPVEYGDGLAARLRDLVPDGFDAAFDTVGGEALRISAETLAPRAGSRPSPTPRSSPTAAATPSYGPTPPTSPTSPDSPSRASSPSMSTGSSPLRRPPRPTGSTRRGAPGARSSSPWPGRTEAARPSEQRRGGEHRERDRAGGRRQRIARRRSRRAARRTPCPSPGGAPPRGTPARPARSGPPRAPRPRSPRRAAPAGTRAAPPPCTTGSCGARPAASARAGGRGRARAAVTGPPIRTGPPPPSRPPPRRPRG